MSAIQLHTLKGCITIFNLYIDCNHSEALVATQWAIQNNRQLILGQQLDSIIWRADFNWHPALWDKERNHHLFTVSALSTADELIAHLAKFHLTMVLPKGLPTLQSMSTKNWTCMDNVFMSEELMELLICCHTAPGLRGPGMDHVPIHTVVNTGILSVAVKPYRNYRTVDWKDIREELAQQLTQIPKPGILRDNIQIHGTVMDLTKAIQATIEVTIPMSKPVPHSRRWWSDELTVLKKCLNKLNNGSYRYRALADHPVHDALKDIHNKYSDTIKHTKMQHWQDFLEEAQGLDIWTANHYISSPAGDRGRQHISTLKVTRADGTTSEDTTNEEKATAFHWSFLPPKPAATVPDDPEYLV